MNYKKIKINSKNDTKEKIDDTFLIIPSKIINTLIKENKENNVKSKSIFDISLKNFAKNFVKNFKEIMNEFIGVISNNIFIEDEQFTSENNYKNIFFKILKIFTKESRLIYNGFFLLIIAFFIYFIDITSK